MLSRIRYILLLAIVLFSASKAVAQMSMPDAVCSGTTRHYNVNPNPGSTYTWLIDGVIKAGFNRNEIDITWDIAGNHLLQVQETTAAGCLGPMNNGQVYVTAMPVMAAVGRGPVTCGGNGSIDFAFTNVPDGVYTITYDLGSFTSVAVTAGKATVEAMAGTYQNLNITTGSCTSVPVSVTITEPAILTAKATVTNVICFGGTTAKATVTGSGGTLPYTYLWDDPRKQITATASELSEGIYYTAVITDNHGCTANASVTIAAPSAELFVTAVVDQHASCDDIRDGRATATASGGDGNIETYSYLWNDNEAQANATATGLAAGNYTVTVTDGNGCQASTPLWMPSCELLIWMPTAFTPDGNNKKFRPILNPDIAINFNMMIFNKWGEQIFSSDDINEGWDGTFKGERCPPDMYIWIISFEAPQSYIFRQKSPLKGTIMLLK